MEIISKNICSHFNIEPSLNLFVSRLNKQIKNYYSYAPDPFTQHVDAFTISWSSDSFQYMFPPFNLLYRAMSKIRTDNAWVVAVIPMWTNQPWFSLMLQHLTNFPVLLPMETPSILTLPFDSTTPHPNLKSLHLLSVMLSGINADQRKFQNQLQPHFFQDSQCLLDAPILQVQKGSTCFVMNNKLIPCFQLLNISLNS